MLNNTVRRPVCAQATVIRGLATVLIAACLCSPAFADPIDGYFLDPKLFGNMVQPDKNSCSPTAVVNSMVFLENRYWDTYGLKLVGPTPADLLTAETELATDMKTTNGTSITNFIYGKENYFQDHAPNTTGIGAEVSAYWPWGLVKPPGVAAHTKPTAQYIISNLKANRDVEINYLATDGDTTGHTVTVTGMSWNSDDKIGGIYYIDPNDGKLKTQLVTQTDDGFLSWKSPDEKTEYEITDAVWEGPIPEPGTFLLLGSGLLGSVGVLRKRYSRQARERRCLAE